MSPKMKRNCRNKSKIGGFADIKIKAEPQTEKNEQISFINEREFDDLNDDLNDQPLLLPQCANTNEHYVWAKLTSFDKKLFSLNCVRCSNIYPLFKWEEFVDHINTMHTQESMIPDAAADVDDVSVENNLMQVELTENESFYESAMVPEVILENESNMNSEKKVKPLKLHLPPQQKIRENPVRGKMKSPENQIFFDTKKKGLVRAFLIMLKENPMLWHGRHKSMKLYDEIIDDCLPKFNKENRTNFSKDIVQSSVKKMKAAVKLPSFDRKFGMYRRLWNEIEDAAEKMMHKCNKCKSRFYKPIDLQIHKFKEHKIGKMPFNCKKCGGGFGDMVRLEAHEKTHIKQQFTCNICQKVFGYEAFLKSHMNTHYTRVCEVCGQEFDDQTKFSRHKIKHTKPTHECYMCDKAYHESFSLSEHMKSHYDLREYECEECDKAYNTRRALSIHMRTVHKMKLPPDPTPRYMWVRVNENGDEISPSDFSDTNSSSSSSHSNNDEDKANDDDDDKK